MGQWPLGHTAEAQNKLVARRQPLVLKEVSVARLSSNWLSLEDKDKDKDKERLIELMR